MKINRIESKHPKLNKLKDSIIGNLFYFIYLHWMVFLSILGLIISCFVLLFFAEMLFPDTVKIYNYAMTKRAFDELRTQKHFHAAAFVMEQNPEFLKESNDGIEYQMELSDVYFHIGEYNKAEEILLGLYNFDSKAYSKFSDINEGAPEIAFALPMMQLEVAKELMDLYEEMGDKGGQIKYYGLAYNKLEDLQKLNLDSIYMSLDEDKAEELASINFKRLAETTLLLRGFKAKYTVSPLEAISGLQNVVDTLAVSEQYGFEFKLRHISKLVEWKLGNNQKLGAYPYLYLGADLCFSLRNLYDPAFEHAGPLAKAAYAIGDKETGYKLMRLYQKYLEKNYSDDDIARLQGMLLICQYLDSEGDVEELTELLSDICSRLKTEITDNFIGLSSDQREYLVKTLREPFEYASEMAAKYQTDGLANLCLDNLIFERGLLLRSDGILRQAIFNTPDTTTFNKWQTNQRELAARQHMSGLGNTVRMRELRTEISELDKELSKLPAFKSVANFELPSISQIQKSLPNDGVYVEFGQWAGFENEPMLYALLLPKEGSASFVNLCPVVDVEPIMKGGINDIYNDYHLTEKCFKPLQTHLSECNTIFYTTSGVFSQMAIPALRIQQDERIYLADKYNFRLCSSPASIINITRHTQPLIAQNTTVSLWGGIDYGVADVDTLNPSEFRGLERGEPLRYLPGSLEEVQSLNQMFKSNDIVPMIRTASNATKTLFLKDRSNILHISTHGSFDSSTSGNPLASSFLFFANANPSWSKAVPLSHHEQGIVNGIDIQGMNLSECRLVVLSACETGLGYSDVREGVYGLQRAFKLAGADKVLMSMWSVSDAVTSKFMMTFYRNLLEAPTMDPNTALRNAQHEIRRSHPMPEDWGAFVLLD